MGNPTSKRTRLRTLLPSLEGLTLEEASKLIGLSQVTIRDYFYELGGEVAWVERGKIRTNDALIAAATQEGGRHRVAARPATSEGGRSHRVGEPWITNRGLSQQGLNEGLASSIMEMNILTVNMDGLSRTGDEEILERIAREGTAGTGERLG